MPPSSRPFGGIAAVLCAAVLTSCSGGSDQVSTQGVSPGPLTCQPLTQVRTFVRQIALTNALKVTVSADGARDDAVLPAIRAVSVRTAGAPAGDDLWQLVGQHYGTTAARPGEQTGTGEIAYIGSVANHGSGVRSYVVYQSVEIYSGGFTSLCAGKRRSGTYLTYGRVGQGLYECGFTPDGDPARLARGYCA